MRANSMRAAVVGLGWWGKQVIKSLADSDWITVTHGIDPAPQDGLDEFLSKNNVKRGHDYEATLADKSIDAVILATPNTLHEKHVLMAAAAGKQIFCEKPLALSADAAKRMIEACDKAGIVLGTGHERRWEPAMEELFRLVGEGKIGKILHVETNFSHDIFKKLALDNWRFSAIDAPGGGFTARGIHLTDFMVSMFGPARRVWATTSSISWAPPRIDSMAAHITFRNGIVGLVSVSIATPFYGRFTVLGDEGWIETREPSNFERGDPGELTVCDAQARSETTYHQPVNTVRMNFEAWAEAVQGGRPYRIKPEEILANMQIFEAIVESAKRGEVVEIE